MNNKLLMLIKYMVAVAIIFCTPAILICLIWWINFHDVVTFAPYVAIMLMFSLIGAAYVMEGEE